MKYISTSGRFTADLHGAVTNCIAPDGTLYLPERLRLIPQALFNNIEAMSLKEIAYVVATALLGDDISPADLKKVVDDTFIYSIPFKNLRKGVEVMELFEGPTLAFKDFSAQFLANLVKYDKSVALPRVAIAATTGNTGAAVANAFARHRDRRVIILYPHHALSPSQIAQFTTLGANVHPVEVSGDIGKCKLMVRDAIADESLRPMMKLISANTSNFLRIVPQVALFFYAYSRLKAKYGREADGFSPSIPCGNLSSLTSAIIAKRLGLPMGKIIAGCNANDDLVRVLSGELTPQKVNISSRATLAKAMDSGYPTNLSRVLTLYGRDIERVKKDVAAFSASDAEIEEIIKRYSESGYLADPHTAAALSALEKSGTSENGHAVVFATAHPAKSLDTMTSITGRSIDLPLQLTRFMTRGVAPTKMPPSYQALRKYLLNTINS